MAPRLLLLLACVTATSMANTIREYFIAAEEVEWDYAPSGVNQWTGGPLSEGDAAVFTDNTDFTIGKVYRKALYIEYTDASFTEVKAKPDWLGFNGPIIRAEVGDTIVAHFLNRASIPYSMHAHGVQYSKLAEGATYQFASPAGGNAVAPGDSFVYVWDVPEISGPAEADGSAKLWAYHSHNDEVADTYAGLIGPMAVYAPGTLHAETGLPTDVDQEFVLVLQVMNENKSHYLAANCETYGCGNPDDPAFDTAAFEESNLMHAINGFVYGNMPAPAMATGERVRWLVAAFGTEVDLHTVHWHANTLVVDGHRADVVELLPASFHTALMIPKMPGLWPIHCHVNDHILAGMVAYYSVTGATPPPPQLPEAVQMELGAQQADGHIQQEQQQQQQP